MIRLKQAMGNAIKCKVDAEYMISKYECNVLNSHRLNGLFDFKSDKSGIVYSGDTKKNLSARIESGIDEKSLGGYVHQVASLFLDIQKLGLNPEKLVLNPEWIFLEKDEATLKFIYCPVNGAVIQYDVVLFMRDLVLQANLGGEMRKKWNRWLDETAKKGINERRIGALAAMVSEMKPTGRTKPALDDDGEALTGMEDEFTWGGEDNDSFEEEAATGMEQTYSWNFSSNDDDDEAPTGMDDDCIFSGSNLGDGTYSESTQEPWSLAGIGSRKSPQLIRKSTGESKKITKNEFKIGRSEQRADFCIKGNSGVSNVHAIVMLKGNKYYLKDNHSTNGTYVDDIKITDSSTQIPLQDGSIIRVYNEELEFRM